MSVRKSFDNAYEQPMTNGRLAVCGSSDWFQWLPVGKGRFEASGVAKETL